MSHSKRKKKKLNVSLESKIEVLREPPVAQATNDSDVLSYVNDFMKAYSEIPPLPPTSLLTAEDAKKALVVLEEAQARVTAHLKTARALKRLLQTKQDE